MMGEEGSWKKREARENLKQGKKKWVGSKKNIAFLGESLQWIT
jgi:hypothetical protein